MAWDIVRAILFVIIGFIGLYQGLMLLCGVGKLAKRARQRAEAKGKDGRHFMRVQGALLQIFGVMAFVISVLVFFPQARSLYLAVHVIAGVLLLLYVVRS